MATDKQFSGTLGVEGGITLGLGANATRLEANNGQLFVNGNPVAAQEANIPAGDVLVSSPARAGLGVTSPNTIIIGRMPMTAYVSMSGVRFMYAGMANSENLCDNETLVEAAIEYPSGTIYPVTFNGQRFGTLDRYGQLLSDPTAIDIPAGATYYARTRVMSPNNATNLVPLNGYTALAADVTAGAASMTLVDLPVSRPSPTRLRITGASTEVVEVIRFTTVASPYTATLRNVLAANHTAAGNQVGQGFWTNREVYSDQGGTASSSSTTFDLYSGTFGAAAVSGASTLAATANIGDRLIQIVNINPLRGTSYTIDAGGTPETVTARTVVGVANPYTMYLTAALTIQHLSGVAIANTNSGGSVIIPVPSAVIADHAAGEPVAITLLGDSILQGTGNYFRQWESYATLALEPTHPVIQMSKSGESAQQFAANTNGFQRRSLIGLGKWLFYGFGTNDIYGGRTLAQFQADTITICDWARARGMKIAMPTITPRTTSTDGWITVANQTEINAGTGGLVRKAVNAWIRSGAGGYCDLVVEAADAIETSRDSGILKADTTVGPYVVDGLHPSYAGHVLIAAAVKAAMFT